MCVLKCPWCSILFEREKRQTHLIKTKVNYTCCSRSCRGSFSRQIQLHGRTPKEDLAIQENIVRTYRKFLTEEGKHG